MVAVGLFLLLDPLQDGTMPALVLVGLVATTVSDILLGYLILAFPWGTLRSNVDRAFLAVERGRVALRESGGPRWLRPASVGRAVTTTRIC